MDMKKLVPVVFAAAMSGCCAFNATEYPQVAVVAPQGDAAKLAVAVTGFEAVVTEYESMYGYSTVYVPGYLGRRHYHPGHYENVTTHTLIPRTRATDAFLKRAQEMLEDAGFTLATSATPDWTVEVHFNGPAVASGDVWLQWGLRLVSLFTFDFEAATWTAKLRIRDNRTGKIVFRNEYVQGYQANAFGLIPIFGIASCTETSAEFIQSWCLGALTDRTVADAAAFLSNPISGSR